VDQEHLGGRQAVADDLGAQRQHLLARRGDPATQRVALGAHAVQGGLVVEGRWGCRDRRRLGLGESGGGEQRQGEGDRAAHGSGITSNPGGA
jgi:hypothetical protein